MEDSVRRSYWGVAILTVAIFAAFISLATCFDVGTASAIAAAG